MRNAPRSKPSKVKKGTKLAASPKSATGQAIQKRPLALTLPERIESVVMEGDLAVLSVPERLQYVKSLCHSLRIDWRGRPFAYIILNGKMVLYALKNCTDQLRKVHGVSVISSKRTTEGELCIFEIEVKDRTGRVDTGVGAWAIGGLSKREHAVNANAQVRKRKPSAERRSRFADWVC